MSLRATAKQSPRAGQHHSKTGARATGLVEGSIDQSIKELRDQIIEFNRAGRAIKVDRLGTFSPSIDLDGNLAICYRPDPALSNGLNIPGVFTGTIYNRENIGKTSEELVTKWMKPSPKTRLYCKAYNPKHVIPAIWRVF